MSTNERYAINLEAEELQPVHYVAKQITGKRPAPVTIYRWIRNGCRGVQLPAVIIGGAWFTTHDAYAWWIRAQTAAALIPRSSRANATDDELRASRII